MAGVSQVTVSRALSDPSKVSPATLKRIQEAIAVTGFVPNALAGALASRKKQADLGAGAVHHQYRLLGHGEGLQRPDARPWLSDPPLRDRF
ncbi:LacI family DNA-binding transcriptional regulator [Roseibium salinum]|nr:LacI family DNA-binding transcriptional regulator [Roseibium salinum]